MNAIDTSGTSKTKNKRKMGYMYFSLLCQRKNTAFRILAILLGHYILTIQSSLKLKLSISKELGILFVYAKPKGQWLGRKSVRSSTVTQLGDKPLSFSKSYPNTHLQFAPAPFVNPKTISSTGTV